MTEPRAYRFDALKLQRVGHWCLERRIPLMPLAMQALCQVLFGAVVFPETSFGPNVWFDDRGLGIAVHERAQIGANVVVGTGVVIGGRSRFWGVPVIEEDCYIGVGAVILGPVRLGRGSVVGANAVVINDVPPRSLVVGVPARVIREDIDVKDYL
jgi:Serine acetyltransferase